MLRLGRRAQPGLGPAALKDQTGEYSTGGYGEYSSGVDTYVRRHATSAERTAWLPAFLAFYNARRPHSALGYRPPASRLGGNNLLQLNT